MNLWFSSFLAASQQPSIKEMLIGTTSSGISYQLGKYTPYAGAAGMLLHINRKLTRGTLK
jgi:hypothetical protein